MEICDIDTFGAFAMMPPNFGDVDILKWEDPLKHLLLILEYQLLNAVASQRMQTLTQIIVLLGLLFMEVCQLLFQSLDLGTEFLLSLRAKTILLPCSYQ